MRGDEPSALWPANLGAELQAEIRLQVEVARQVNQRRTPAASSHHMSMTGVQCCSSAVHFLQNILFVFQLALVVHASIMSTCTAPCCAYAPACHKHLPMCCLSCSYGLAKVAAVLPCRKQGPQDQPAR